MKGNTTTDKLGASDVALASSISKIFASTLTYPHEVGTKELHPSNSSVWRYHMFKSLTNGPVQVVRSRLQEQGHHSEKRYTGITDCIKKVLQHKGIPGFYRGCATNLLRTTPAAVITFTSFEMIHRFLVASYPPDSQTQALWRWSLHKLSTIQLGQGKGSKWWFQISF